jgi:hypothetical protein
MASGIFVNESGRILVSLFFWIGKRVTILLPIFFYHKLAQSLLNMGLGRVVTPPAERSLAPSVTKRKVSGGSRSMKRFEETADLRSCDSNLSFSSSFSNGFFP